VDFANLNRRHKVGLLAVLAGAGLCLILDASAKQTAGVVMLGLAGTWLLGDLSLRTIRLLASFLFFAGGLSMVIVPVLIDRQSSEDSARDYDLAIVDLRAAVAKSVSIQWDDLKPPSGKAKSNSGKADNTPDFIPDPPPTLPSGFFDKPPAEQAAYLSHVDADFAKATPADQRAYIQFVTKIAKSSTKTVEIPQSTQRWERRDQSDVSDPYAKYGGSEDHPKQTPTEHGPWEKYATPETHPVPSREGTQIPAGAKIENSATGVLEALTFDGTVSDEEIVRSIHTEQLMPRPTFSLWSSTRSHERTSGAGASFAVLGLLGWLWLMRGKGRVAP